MKIIMNTPKFLFYLILSIPFFQLHSQNASDDCRENLSIFAESAKIKNYKAAYELSLEESNHNILDFALLMNNYAQFHMNNFEYDKSLEFFRQSSKIYKNKI